MSVLEEMFKQGLYTGIGLVLKTGDLLADIGNNVTETFKMSQEEGRQFFEKLMKRSAEVQSNLSELQDEKLKEKLAKLNLARQDDLLRLKTRITKLELLLKEKGVVTDIPEDSPGSAPTS